MKRFLRILRNSLTVLSLLFFLATVVMWVRSDSFNEILVKGKENPRRFLVATNVGIEYFRTPASSDNPLELQVDSTVHWWQGWKYRRGLWSAGSSGFIFRPEGSSGGFRIGLPYWFLFLLTALAPAARLVRHRFRKPPPPGLCPNCHYDLRATPDRCPECGTVVAEASSVEAQK